MAQYQTHLIGAAAAGALCTLAAFHLQAASPLQLPLVLVAGIAGGMAPDLDSDGSKSLRWVFGAAALLLPALLIYRFPIFRPDLLGVIGSWILLALAVRGPGAWLFKRATRHRGTWHSLPAAAATGVATLLALCPEGRWSTAALAIAAATSIGYLTHLVLDETHALVDFSGGNLRPRRSLGTALALKGSSPASTLGVYLILAWLVWRTTLLESL